MVAAAGALCVCLFLFQTIARNEWKIVVCFDHDTHKPKTKCSPLFCHWLSRLLHTRTEIVCVLMHCYGTHCIGSGIEFEQFCLDFIIKFHQISLSNIIYIFLCGK